MTDLQQQPLSVRLRASIAIQLDQEGLTDAERHELISHVLPRSPARLSQCNLAELRRLADGLAVHRAIQVLKDLRPHLLRRDPKLTDAITGLAAAHAVFEPIITAAGLDWREAIAVVTFDRAT